MKKNFAKLVKVVWMDATEYTKDTEYNEEDLNKPSKLLTETTTYGLLASEDSKAILIIHETTSDNEKIFTVIPKYWIKQITKLPLT